MKHAEKMPAPKDWHPADIKAALVKAGWSFNQLGLYHGYTSKSALTGVLRNPWPKAESLIAEAIGVAPHVIWPSRYNTDGTPNRVKGRQPVRPAGLPAVASHSNARASAGNPQSRTARSTGKPSSRQTVAP